MKKGRFVSTIFAAAASLAASAVSFIPTDDSSSFYEESSLGEKIFVGEADSANIKFTLDKESNIYNTLLVSKRNDSNVLKDTVKVDSTFKIGTNKCYTFLYTTDKEKTEKVYLCYIKKTAIAPTVKVCAYDSVSNPVCDPQLRVKFSNLSFANTYVNSKGDTVQIKDNIVLTYQDYEANGITISDKAVEEKITGINKDSSLLITKPKRHTVFKLKDKLTKYEYTTDTFYSYLPFMTAQLTVDAEIIPHNIENRTDEALVFSTKDEAKASVSSHLYSGDLYINLEHNSIDNAPIDTVITVDPNDTTKSVTTLVPVDASYSWKFYNDSTGVLRNSYRSRTNATTLSGEHIDKYGTHFIVLSGDNSVCKDTLVAAFKVRNSLLEMPSVFTPNGDGINDEFRPTYTSISEYEIWIYNTMGKLMYNSEDITVGWDGTHRGNDCPIGAYYYVVKAKGVDGIEYKLKGTVNLVRNAD